MGNSNINALGWIGSTRRVGSCDFLPACLPYWGSLRPKPCSCGPQETAVAPLRWKACWAMVARRLWLGAIGWWWPLAPAHCPPSTVCRVVPRPGARRSVAPWLAPQRSCFDASRLIAAYSHGRCCARCCCVTRGFVNASAKTRWDGLPFADTSLCLDCVRSRWGVNAALCVAHYEISALCIGTRCPKDPILCCE